MLVLGIKMGPLQEQQVLLTPGAPRYSIYIHLQLLTVYPIPAE